MVEIDLSDPKVYQVAALLAISWGVAVGLVIYNIAGDVRELISKRSPKRQPVDRRFVEPCATDMHTYDDDGLACTTCKQPKEPLP